MPSLYGTRALLFVSLLAALLASSSCKKSDDSSDGRSKCSGDLCLEVYRTFYSTGPCDGAPKETCQYANVFFVLNDGDKSVLDLKADDVEMSVNGRKVGVEGTKALTSSNGLLVSLLLDQSYSITESGSEMAVKDGAEQFLDSLPDEALVSVATFASEGEVPTLVCADGSASTNAGWYASKQDAKVAVEYHYDAYDVQTSSSQTKIYDAVENFARFTPNAAALQQLQRVMVVFTDGADTASVTTSAAATRRMALAADPSLKIYAIGLGKDVDKEALDEISEGRVFIASSSGELKRAFDEVASALGAIYQLRVLVSQVESGATGDFTLMHGGHTLSTTFNLDTGFVDDGSGGDQGGSDQSGPLCGAFPDDFDEKRLQDAIASVGGTSAPGDGDMNETVTETESFDDASKFADNWTSDADASADAGTLTLDIPTAGAGKVVSVWREIPYSPGTSTKVTFGFDGLQINAGTVCAFALTGEGPYEIFDPSRIFEAGVGIQVDQSVAQLRDFSDSSVVDTTDHDPADTMKATVVYDSENKKVTATVEGSDSTGTLWTKDLTLPLDFTSSATYLALACASETGVLDQATVDELTFSVTTPKP